MITFLAPAPADFSEPSSPLVKLSHARLRARRKSLMMEGSLRTILQKLVKTKNSSNSTRPVLFFKNGQGHDSGHGQVRVVVVVVVVVRLRK
jgi:hypothetical protein